MSEESNWVWSDTLDGGPGVEFVIADLDQFCCWDGQHVVILQGPWASRLPATLLAQGAVPGKAGSDPESHVVIPAGGALQYVSDMWEAIQSIQRDIVIEPEGQYSYVFVRELLYLKGYALCWSTTEWERQIFLATHGRALCDINDPLRTIDILDPSSGDVKLSVTMSARPGPVTWEGKESACELVRFAPPRTPSPQQAPTSSFELLHAVLDPLTKTGDNPITIGLNAPDYTEVVIIRPDLDPRDPGGHSDMLPLFHQDFLTRVRHTWASPTRDGTTLSTTSGILIVDSECHGSSYLAYDLDIPDRGDTVEIKARLSTLPFGLDPELRCNLQTEEEVSAMRTVLRVHPGQYHVVHGCETRRIQGDDHKGETHCERHTHGLRYSYVWLRRLEQ